MFNRLRKFTAMALVAAMGLLLSMSAQAQYSIVSSDSNGTITFTPNSMVVPIITGVVAGIIAATSLIVLWKGAKWLWKVVKGAN